MNYALALPVLSISQHLRIKRKGDLADQISHGMQLIASGGNGLLAFLQSSMYVQESAFWEGPEHA